MPNPPLLSPETEFTDGFLRWRAYPDSADVFDAWDLNPLIDDITAAAAAAAAAQSTANAASPLTLLPKRGHFHSDEATYIAGTAARNIDATYPYVAGLYTTTQNAHAEFYLTCRAGASMTVSVLTQQIANAGILTLYLDGTLFGTQDLYAAATNKATLIANTTAALAAGDHTLAFKCLTKNASSSGFIMFLNLIQWRIN